ncbi:DUF1849 family protein [Siculibacillus lacustris]|uniref:DUF1849 family protein n=1 Tax=Siculibacillus lacustris TaxID=1549641 RepID=A0A4Q9VGX4_9HYPH|nr:cell envelope integrity EipB family protein [Siculibacillus lacustris]TBW34310.1 DUF1849 family protein [Siculibacillus lacustris]
MPSTRARGLLAAASLLVVFAAPSPGRAADVLAGLAPHRAVYEMRLEKRNERAEVVAVDGRLVYEFTGSVCDGFASQYRLVTRLQNQDGTSRVSDMRTSSFEDGEGRSFDFLNQNFVDQRQIEDTKGVARHETDAVRVHLVRPASKSLDVTARAKFPTQHLAAIIEAATAGRTLQEIELFDGSENGERTYRTTVVIGREKTGDDADADEPAAASPLLAGHRRWPVGISYFALDKVGGGEETPEYQMNFVLYDNGISRRMRLDYGDFSLAGTLTSLTALDTATACRR